MEESITKLADDEIMESVRAKLVSRCNMSCKFCHQEGSPGSEVMELEGLMKALEFLKEDLGVSEVHYTGGEPFLHPNINDMISEAVERGFDVSITTNGFYDREVLEQGLDNGISSVNFSIKSLDPGKWLEQQEKEYSFETAERAIHLLKNNIKFCDDRADTKVNKVVSDDLTNALEVFEYCREEDLNLRLLDDLGNEYEAIKNIEFMIEFSDAEKIGEEREPFSSSYKKLYRADDGYEFAVKSITHNYLVSMCSGCDFARDDCLEKFYGIRLESDPVHARLCLQKDGEPYVQKFEDFKESDQYEEIRKVVNNYGEGSDIFLDKEDFFEGFW